jgi:hypothetical protein
VVESISLIQFHKKMSSIEAMGSRNRLGPSANLQNTENGREKQKSERRSFLQPPSCSVGSRLSSGGRILPWVTLGGSHIASEGGRWGHVWPQGVAGGLGGSGVTLGITDGLVGMQMASWSHGWPLGVGGCLWGLQLTSGGHGNQYLDVNFSRMPQTLG